MGFQPEYTSYYDKKAAEIVPDIKYKWAILSICYC